MADYIGRDAVYHAISVDGRLNIYEKAYCLDIVRKITSADVDMVRHGRWEWFEEWDPGTTDHPRECQDSGWRCGECKTALEDVVGGCWDDPDEEQKLKFCPNCGCCMDGGDPT